MGGELANFKDSPEVSFSQTGNYPQNCFLNPTAADVEKTGPFSPVTDTSSTYVVTAMPSNDTCCSPSEDIANHGCEESFDKRELSVLLSNSTSSLSYCSKTSNFVKVSKNRKIVFFVLFICVKNRILK